MKIKVLDAKTLGNDVDLAGLQKFGDLEIFETTTAAELPERIKDAEIIVTNKVLIGKKEFDYAKNIKLICIAATGYNNIDLESATKHGVIVANVRNYSTESVAQHTFSLILAIENSLVDYVKETRSGNWSKSPVFTMLDYPFNEINGKTIGIIGYGTIGKRVAEIAKAFGMKVLIGKRKNVDYQDIERVEFDELLAESDIINIHTPLSENTRNMFAMSEFEKMKNTAILINAARGGIVNENDLYTALKNGIIRAAATDVTEKEPIEAENKLITLNNMFITPHIAWASLESRKRLIDGIIANINDFISGKKVRFSINI